MGAGASAETLANASFEEVAAGERAEGWLQEMGSSHPETTGTQTKNYIAIGWEFAQNVFRKK